MIKKPYYYYYYYTGDPGRYNFNNDLKNIIRFLNNFNKYLNSLVLDLSSNAETRKINDAIRSNPKARKNEDYIKSFKLYADKTYKEFNATIKELESSFKNEKKDLYSNFSKAGLTGNGLKVKLNTYYFLKRKPSKEGVLTESDKEYAIDLGTTLLDSILAVLKKCFGINELVIDSVKELAQLLKAALKLKFMEK